jgi:gliding motility-associated-like protein
MKQVFIKYFVPFLIFPLCSNAQLSYTYTLVHAYCGCNGTASVNITSGVAPYSFTLNATTTTTNNVFNNLCAGNYTLFIEDSNVPNDKDTIYFTIQDSTFKDTIIARDGCNSKGTASISLSGGWLPYSYTISPLGVSSLTLSNLSDGIYTFIAKDNAGCTLTNTFSINNYSVVSNFSMSANSAKVGSTVLFTNLSQNASGFLWDFGNGNTSTGFDVAETYTTTGTFLVKLIAYYNTCSDTSYKYLNIADKLIFTAPNIFTPNNDDVNDLWYVFSEGAVNMHLEIFNRWGVKIYENNGTGVQWDGRTLSGEPVPEGTYFYSIEITDVLNNVNKFSGYITLMR